MPAAIAASNGELASDAGHPVHHPDTMGKSVYHCRIPGHEDNGMMANIVVLPK